MIMMDIDDVRCRRCSRCNGHALRAAAGISAMRRCFARIYDAGDMRVEEAARNISAIHYA